MGCPVSLSTWKAASSALHFFAQGAWFGGALTDTGGFASVRAGWGAEADGISVVPSEGSSPGIDAAAWTALALAARVWRPLLAGLEDAEIVRFFFLVDMKYLLLWFSRGRRAGRVASEQHCYLDRRSK